MIAKLLNLTKENQIQGKESLVTAWWSGGAKNFSTIKQDLADNTTTFLK